METVPSDGNGVSPEPAAGEDSEKIYTFTEPARTIKVFATILKTLSGKFKFSHKANTMIFYLSINHSTQMGLQDAVRPFSPLGVLNSALVPPDSHIFVQGIREAVDVGIVVALFVGDVV